MKPNQKPQPDKQKRNELQCVWTLYIKTISNVELLPLRALEEESRAWHKSKTTGAGR